MSGGLIHAGCGILDGIYRSADGITWLQSVDNTYGGVWSLSCAFGDIYAGTHTGNAHILVSADDVNWADDHEEPGRSRFRGMCLFGSYIYAILTSTDQVFRSNGGAWSAADGHFRHIKATADRARREWTGPEREKAKDIYWSATRGQAWTGARLKHVGAPVPTPVVPRTPAHRRHVEEENAAMAACNAAVDADNRLKGAAGGWLGLMRLGGVTGWGGLLALALRHRKTLLDIIAGKDRAIDQHDSAVDRLAKRTRNAFKGADLEREHAVRRNGAAAT